MLHVFVWRSCISSSLQRKTKVQWLPAEGIANMPVAVSLENPVIAVVDDDRSVCIGVQRLLRASRLSAITFTSGVDFLASLAITTPDCIVLDLTMREINGLAAITLALQSRKQAT